MVGDEGAGRGPVLVSPLGIDVSLRPGGDCDLAGVADTVDVVDGVGDILGV